MELKNAAGILKNTSESFKSRLAEERISELEARLFENTQKRQKEKELKKKQDLENSLKS